MKKYWATLVFSICALACGAASAQTNSTISNGTQSTAQQQSSINNAINFPSGGPSDVTYHGSYTVKGNASVGLGSFAGSFSADYCGGTTQGGFSFPGFTGAFGMPTLGAAGQACVDMRAIERTMQMAVTYGKAAASAQQAGNVDAAQQFASTSTKLALAAQYILCGVSDQVESAYKKAGIDCGGAKGTQVSAPVASVSSPKVGNRQVADWDTSDPVLRYHHGLPPLASK